MVAVKSANLVDGQCVWQLVGAFCARLTVCELQGMRPSNPLATFSTFCIPPPSPPGGGGGSLQVRRRGKPAAVQYLAQHLGAAWSNDHLLIRR